MAKQLSKEEKKLKNLREEFHEAVDTLARVSDEKKALQEENNYLKQQISDYNQLINQLEEEIITKGSHNEALQDVIVHGKQRYELLSTAFDSTVSAAKSEMSIASRLIQLLFKFVEEKRQTIADLEQDKHHMTIQRDAAKDELKYTRGVLQSERENVQYWKNLHGHAMNVYSFDRAKSDNSTAATYLRKQF